MKGYDLIANHFKLNK